MKKLTFLFVLLSTVVAMGQSVAINAALAKGDSKALSAYFDNSISITILETENTYSKAQAEVILFNFFEKHKAKGCTPVHDGTSPEGSRFSVGNLLTASGVYRTFILVKQKGNVSLIQEIRFEEP